MEDNQKRCGNCWWAGRPDEHQLVKCNWHGNEVYALSIPCDEWCDKCPYF